MNANESILQLLFLQLFQKLIDTIPNPPVNYLIQDGILFRIEGALSNICKIITIMKSCRSPIANCTDPTNLEVFETKLQNYKLKSKRFSINPKKVAENSDQNSNSNSKFN